MTLSKIFSFFILSAMLIDAGLFPGATVFARDIDRFHSGSWYNPAQNGLSGLADSPKLPGKKENRHAAFKR